MKRCIALFLAFSVMFAVCAVPASAADSYSVSADSVPLSLSRSSLYEVAATSVEYSELSSLFQSYLSTTTSSGRETVAALLSSINSILGNTSYGLSLTNLLDDIRSNTQTTGSYLNQNGGTTSSTLTNVGIASLVRNGFLGLSVKLENLADAVDGGSDYTSVLSQILTAANNINTSLSTTNTRLNTINTSVCEVETAVGKVETAVGEVETSVGQVNTSVGQVNTNIVSLINYLRLGSDSDYLNQSGTVGIAVARTSLTSLVRSGFLGLSANISSVRDSLVARMQINSSAEYLNASGGIGTAVSGTGFTTLLRTGFLGLRSAIAGSETDNVYSFTLWDNNNTSSTSSASGLGPLINAQLGNVGANLAKLTFMFASDEDIELKQDSQPVTDYVSDELLNPDSTGRIKLSVGNVSNVTVTADDFLGYLETDGQLSDINAVMDDDSTWTWFTSAAAADLDTTSGAAAAALSDSDDDDQSAGSHYEWYAAFFRDVLGREYKGG